MFSGFHITLKPSSGSWSGVHCQVGRPPVELAAQCPGVVKQTCPTLVYTFLSPEIASLLLFPQISLCLRGNLCPTLADLKLRFHLPSLL